MSAPESSDYTSLHIDPDCLLDDLHQVSGSQQVYEEHAKVANTDWMDMNNNGKWHLPVTINHLDEGYLALGVLNNTAMASGSAHDSSRDTTSSNMLRYTTILPQFTVQQSKIPSNVDGGISDAVSLSSREYSRGDTRANPNAHSISPGWSLKHGESGVGDMLDDSSELLSRQDMQMSSRPGSFNNIVLSACPPRSSEQAPAFFNQAPLSGSLASGYGETRKGHILPDDELISGNYTFQNPFGYSVWYPRSSSLYAKDCMDDWGDTEPDQDLNLEDHGMQSNLGDREPDQALNLEDHGVQRPWGNKCREITYDEPINWNFTFQNPFGYNVWYPRSNSMLQPQGCMDTWGEGGEPNQALVLEDHGVQRPEENTHQEISCAFVPAVEGTQAQTRADIEPMHQNSVISCSRDHTLLTNSPHIDPHDLLFQDRGLEPTTKQKDDKEPESSLIVQDARGGCLTRSAIDELSSDLSLPNKIRYKKLCERLPVRMETLNVWAENMLPTTMVYGALREDTAYASIFRLSNCAYSMFAVQTDGEGSHDSCSNMSVFAYGTLHVSVEPGQRPVKLERVVGCCENHKNHMSSLGMYPIPACQTLPSSACHWLATNCGTVYTLHTACSHHLKNRSYMSPSPNQPKPHTRWKQYSEQFSNKFASLNKYLAATLTFPAEHLELFDRYTSVDSTVEYVEHQDKSMTFHIPEQQEVQPSHAVTHFVQERVEPVLLMTVYQHTSRKNRVLLHSFSSSAGQQTIMSPQKNNGPHKGMQLIAPFHPAIKCNDKDCGKVAFNKSSPTTPFKFLSTTVCPV